MDFNQFWDLIERSRVSDDPDEHCEALAALLGALEPGEVIAFERIFDGYHVLAYRAKLWAAFYIRDRGCSDDAFMDWRQGLIAAGREIFDRIVVDPDSLADHPELEPFEELGYVASDVYEEATGVELPEIDRDGIMALMAPEYLRLGLDPAYDLGSDPLIKGRFEEPDELARVLPRVWAAYGEDEEDDEE